MRGVATVVCAHRALPGFASVVGPEYQYAAEVRRDAGEHQAVMWTGGEHGPASSAVAGVRDKERVTERNAAVGGPQGPAALNLIRNGDTGTVVAAIHALKASAFA